MNKLLALVLVLFSTLTWADNRSWSESEKTWGIVTANLLLLDYATTRDLSHRYNEGYHENNPILGRHPSTGQVDLYFVTAGLATWLIADNLDGHRKTFLQAVSAIELICVGNNIRIGLKVRF